jgi:exodeoxyribonuclease III
MRIATWNVNSVRARLPRVLPWLAENRPDVLCMQETKVQDEAFPREPFEELGYNVETFGQKTYNGVAILARHRIEDVRRGIGDGVEEQEESRVLAATVGDVMLLNLYVVNGQEVGADRYFYKLAWLERVRLLVAERFDLNEKVVVMGDFNVTFDDRDVHDPVRWHEKILCSTPEREALGRVVGCGLHDAFRKFHEEGGHYTWWDFRTRALERGFGLRIDHFLMSEPAYAACSDVSIDVAERGRERPSDHAPLIATVG